MDRVLVSLDRIYSLFAQFKLNRLIRFFWNKPFVFITTIAVFILFLPRVVNAWVGAAITEAFSHLFSKILNPLLTFLIGLMGDSFQWSLEANRQITQQFSTLQEGFDTIRMTADMFFIIILLIVAFATILGIESWNFKTILPKFIVAVLLVNFGQVLSTVVVKLGNIVLEGIINSVGGVVGASRMIGTVTYLQKAFEFNEEAKKNFTDPKVADNIITFAPYFNFLFLLIAASVIFRLILTFLIRVVALWFLMIISPLALVAMVLPSTKKYGEQWIQELLKYTFLGPIAVFMFAFAVKLSYTTLGSNFSPGDATGSGQMGSAYADKTLLPKYGLILMILWFAGTIAKQAGGSFAEAVYGVGKKWAGRAAWFAGGALWGATKFTGTTGAGWAQESIGRRSGRGGAWKVFAHAFNPQAAVTAWKARRTESKERVQSEMVGQWRNTISNTWGKLGFGKEAGNFEQMARDKNADRASMQMFDKDKYETQKGLSNVVTAFKAGNSADLEGALITMVKNVDFNDLENVFDKNNVKGMKELGLSDEDIEKVSIDLEAGENLHDLIKNLVAGKGNDSERAKQLSQTVQAMAPAAGAYHLYGETTTDAKGNTIRTSDGIRESKAYKNATSKEGREQNIKAMMTRKKEDYKEVHGKNMSSEQEETEEAELKNNYDEKVFQKIRHWRTSESARNKMLTSKGRALGNLHESSIYHQNGLKQGIAQYRGPELDIGEDGKAITNSSQIERVGERIAGGSRTANDKIEHSRQGLAEATTLAILTGEAKASTIGGQTSNYVSFTKNKTYSDSQTQALGEFIDRADRKSFIDNLDKHKYNRDWSKGPGKGKTFKADLENRFKNAGKDVESVSGEEIAKMFIEMRSEQLGGPDKSASKPAPESPPDIGNEDILKGENRYERKK